MIAFNPPKKCIILINILKEPDKAYLVEVFQKVLVKMVHTAVVEGEDPKKVVQRYLASYRAAPHKTTGKSPFEMMFNRKMMTKLPQLPSKVNKKLDKEVREKHDKEKEKQKSYADTRRKATEKEVKPGDKVLVQQKKSTLKTPWEPVPYEVTEVKGSRVRVQRGDLMKNRAKNNIKVVKERPERLQLRNKTTINKIPQSGIYNTQYMTFSF